MQPALAKESDSNSLARLGGLTLQIVHDLKNQINGLKLYATFLRKRLEREHQPADERETLAKLIAGLDRAAKDLTALVRCARPVELRKQPAVDVRRIVASVIAEAAERETGGLPRVTIQADFQGDSFIGEFDPTALTEAIKSITDDVRATISTKEPQALSLVMRLDREKAQANIEWRGGRFNPRSASLSANGCGTIYTEVARKIIEAHGGAVSCNEDVIHALLPLSNEMTDA